MKIAVVTGFYSEGMGYTENCLPKAFARLGHEVHVIASSFNVYGTSPDYDATYKAFLGPANQGVGTFASDGYTVHRLPSRAISGYLWLRGLPTRLGQIRPDVVHCTEIASLQSFMLAAVKPLLGYKYFTETHQHMSVVKPFLKEPKGFVVDKAIYRLTRTVPTFLASLAAEKCYAIAPDCVQVATRYYGVPLAKTKLQSLGTDLELFRPATSANEIERREQLRRSLGYTPADVVCIYTGRFSRDKNPLALAQAVDRLCAAGQPFHAIFVGEGAQKDAILACRRTRVLPFMKHTELADMYRAADIAVWPRQESLSMLDAAACALPLVVSDTIGESDRVSGNGRVYREDDVEDLARALASLSAASERRSLGQLGRAKMARSFNWSSIAESVVADYVAAAAK